jgi:multiple sugar transport system ATP-binding protein
VQGKVELVEALGAETLVYVTTPRGTQLVARQNNTRNLPRVGDSVGLQIDSAAAHLFDSHGHVVAPAVR